MYKSDFLRALEILRSQHMSSPVAVCSETISEWFVFRICNGNCCFLFLDLTRTSGEQMPGVTQQVRAVGSPVLWWKACLGAPGQLTRMFLLFLGCCLIPGALVAVANRTVLTVGRRHLPGKRRSHPKYLSGGFTLWSGFYIVTDIWSLPGQVSWPSHHPM